MVILIGTLSGAAAPLTSAARNTDFQPRPTLNAAVLKPAQAKILGDGQRAAINGRNTTPLWRAPVVSKLSRLTVSRPADAAMPAAVIKASGGG